jgi:hypothetical protein
MAAKKTLKVETINTDWTMRDEKINTGVKLASHIGELLKKEGGLELVHFTEVSPKAFMNRLEARERYEIAQMWTPYSKSRKTGEWNHSNPVGMGIGWKRGEYSLEKIRSHRTNDSRFMSVMLDTKVKDEEGVGEKTTFMVVGVHLPTRGRWSGGQVMKHVEDYQGDANATLVLGDFNSKNYSKITETFSDDFAISVPRTVATTKAGNTLDNVLFSKEDFEHKKLLYSVNKKDGVFSHHPLTSSCSFSL